MYTFASSSLVGEESDVVVVVDSYYHCDKMRTNNCGRFIALSAVRFVSNFITRSAVLTAT